jgi:hypothetical protein
MVAPELAKIIFKGKKRELQIVEAAHKRKKENEKRMSKAQKTQPKSSNSSSSSTIPAAVTHLVLRVH